uniref:Uncharacterized protein n=1 Tax=Rhizophora mucronata TaxID=61149 RepID=A0A2P2IXJ8_RHIMU
MIEGGGIGSGPRIMLPPKITSFRLSTMA